MIQFLYQLIKKIPLAKCQNFKKIKIDHRFAAFKKLKKKLKFDKFFIFCFINF